MGPQSYTLSSRMLSLVLVLATVAGPLVTLAENCDILRVPPSETWNGGSKGYFRIPITEDIQDWDLQVTFDKPIDLLEQWTTNQSPAGPSSSYSFTGKDWNSVFSAGDALSFDFLYRFPVDTVAPSINSIMFNGQELSLERCPTTTTSTTTTSTTTTVTTTTTAAPTTFTTTTPKPATCGEGERRRSCTKNKGYCIKNSEKKSCKSNGNLVRKRACEGTDCYCCMPPKPTTTPAPTTTTTVGIVSALSGCDALTVPDAAAHHWSGGAKGNLNIDITQDTQDWEIQLTFDKPVQALEQWFAEQSPNSTESSSTYTLTNLSWNGAQSAGSTLAFELLYRREADEEEGSGP